MAEKKPKAEAPKKEKAPEVEKKEIQVIERIIENHEIAPQDAFGKLSRAQIELIKRTVALGASDDELKLFIQVCKGANLNPFLRQAHLVPFWDSKASRERRAIIIGIDGFRAIAESSGKYAGNDDAVFAGEDVIKITAWGDDKKAYQKDLSVPSTAKVIVYKMVEGQRVAFGATARWSEYYPGAKKGMQWHRMPYMMLGKCAEALALRKAFPKLLSGIYAQEEMDQAMKGEEATSGKDQKVRADVVLDAVKKGSIENLDEIEKKMATSEKYTAAQKTEVKKAIAARRKELKTPPKGVIYPDDEESA